MSLSSSPPAIDDGQPQIGQQRGEALSCSPEAANTDTKGEGQQLSQQSDPSDQRGKSDSLDVPKTSYESSSSSQHYPRRPGPIAWGGARSPSTSSSPNRQLSGSQHRLSHHQHSTDGALRSTSTDSTSSRQLGSLSTAHSRHSSRDYKETLDAQTTDEKDGTRIINQYHLVQVIGQGAYGVVFKANLRDDPQSLFAVKELSKTRLRKSKRYDQLRRPPARGRGSSTAAARGNRAPTGESDQAAAKADPLALIRKEIAIMKKLDHPNVLALFEALDDPTRDELYIVVEYCPDGPVIDVKLHQQTQPLTETVARDYFVQILLGIEYLHSNDIIHRDIKPDNVLLCDDKQTCKIVDFGVSEMFSPTDSGSAKASERPKGHGTPAFLSPELCSVNAPSSRKGSSSRRQGEDGTPDGDEDRERETNGRRDDLWAVGVTLYCMVVGHLPFDKSNFLELYDAIRNQEPEYPGYLSSDCVDILQLFLHKDPARRISVDQAREHPWITMQGSHPVWSAAQNLQQVVMGVTEDEIKSAICRISGMFTVARAVSRFKRAKSKSNLRSTSQSSNEGGISGTLSALSSPQHSFSFNSPGVSSPKPPRNGSQAGSTSANSRKESSAAPLRCQSPPSLAEASDENTPGKSSQRDDVKPKKALEDKAKENTKSETHSNEVAGSLVEQTRSVASSSARGVMDTFNASKAQSSAESNSNVTSDASGWTQLPRIVSGVLGSAASGASSLAAGVRGTACDGNSGEDDRAPGPEFCNAERRSHSDALRQALREVETRLEATMRSSDPVGATKHLANHLHQADPLTRLSTGLKGMGLDYFGWGSGKSDNEDKAAGNEGSGQHGARDTVKAQRAQDQRDTLASQDKRLADKGGRVNSSEYYDEDSRGRNVRTGRGCLQGRGSSGVTVDRRSMEAPDDESRRIFSGPPVASPSADAMTHEEALQQVQAMFGSGQSQNKDGVDKADPAQGGVGES